MVESLKFGTGHATSAGTCDQETVEDVLVPSYWVPGGIGIKACGLASLSRPSFILCSTSLSADILPERIVVQEIIWILHGFSHSGLFTLEENVYSINGRRRPLSVPHVAMDVTKDILQHFCKYGNMSYRVRRFAGSVILRTPYADEGQKREQSTYREFTECLRNFIQDFDGELERLQSQLYSSLRNEVGYGLLQLVCDMDQPFRDLEFVHNILDQVMIPLGGDISAGQFLEHVLLDFLVENLKFIWHVNTHPFGRNVWKLLSLIRYRDCSHMDMYSDLIELFETQTTPHTISSTSNKKQLSQDSLLKCHPLLHLHFTSL